MKPIQSILVATDFSAPAGRAEERAARLAAQHEARLTLLYCLSGVGLERLRDRLLHGSARTELKERTKAFKFQFWAQFSEFGFDCHPFWWVRQRVRGKLAD